MIASDHTPADAGCSVMGWNLETSFFDNAMIGEREEVQDMPLFRVKFSKPDEENPYWRKPENTFIDATADQEFLLETGHSRKVSDLKPGDHLQHWCGTGHYSLVESVTAIEPRAASHFTVVPFGHCMVKGGIIAKESR